jgi:hypothetical protein
MLVPAAVITLNHDSSQSVRDMLRTQLHVNEVVDGYVFDDRVAANPDYANLIRKLNMRMIVIRDFSTRAEVANWTQVDVAIYVKSGLAAILKNKFGPPGATWTVQDLTWGKLCVFDRKYK